MGHFCLCLVLMWWRLHALLLLQLRSCISPPWFFGWLLVCTAAPYNITVRSYILIGSPTQIFLTTHAIVNLSLVRCVQPRLWQLGWPCFPNYIWNWLDLICLWLLFGVLIEEGFLAEVRGHCDVQHILFLGDAFWMGKVFFVVVAAFVVWQGVFTQVGRCKVSIV